VSIGSMLQQVRVRGQSQVIDAAGGSTNYDGGLLASRTNIGDFERRETTYIPEINLSLSRQLTKRLDFTMGYTFIYLSSVVLAGDQIDLNVNGSQVFGGMIVPPEDPRPPRQTAQSLHRNVLARAGSTRNPPFALPQPAINRGAAHSTRWRPGHVGRPR